ncbi:MAG TPA: hypothetical protein VF627_07300, partial [Abditibacterium sp.]
MKLRPKFLLLCFFAASRWPVAAQTQAAPTTATPVPTAAPTTAPTPGATQSPITAPNTQVPAATPSPLLPRDNQPASASPSAQNQQFENPNQVLPGPPLAPIGAPNVPAEVASSSPVGPLVAPTPTPVPADPEDGDIQSGDEGSLDTYSLDLPGGFIAESERGLLISQGPVTLRYGEFSVRGDRGIINENNNRRIATLAGNLTATVRGQVFTGRSLTFDLDTGRWTLSSLAATFPPEVFPPGAVLEPIYLRDASVTGRDDIFGGQDFKLSSCDRNHYYIQSQRLDFYRTPGGQPSRIVLRRNAIYLLGRRIVPLPNYVISLLGSQTRRQPLQATFGQNTTDGYFVRSLLDLRATAGFSDSLLIDALQRRGLGLGFQRQYAATAGILSLY